MIEPEEFKKILEEAIKKTEKENELEFIKYHIYKEDDTPVFVKVCCIFKNTKTRRKKKCECWLLLFRWNKRHGNGWSLVDSRMVDYDWCNKIRC